MKLLTQGLGAEEGLIAIYVENPPSMSEYHNLQSVQSLSTGEIDIINQACGNGWRKVFNVYAKILAEWQHRDHHFTNFKRWQDYRDKVLLQGHSQEALLFSPPNFSEKNYKFHVIAGRTYAKKLLQDHIFTNSLVWLDEEFAIDKVSNLVICPYLDYRQLSNIKITRLVGLLAELERTST
ncbi:DUF6942 family protein [Pseudoalteromonas phenolica]|uniref:Uncharacterized protein n=1 Tax=Pseudoalteromonas phenolica TaxID=161398 RepID=A0A0S2K668_9GAMM|nr:hypothetical protein [Pseudoalteromonas phenolica]ALO43904.1 hypothetical protein PP2015_3429 [Pseudoalteromonas phenolica]MBE0356873.1 hypothetical protein [Pseudoalteromonas phenolica O-BC30]RXE95784.1 hypothetical protein D9981_14205 [Pseudoalteromonas phenolica O-BC30]